MKILALDFSTLRRAAAILEIADGESQVIESVSQEPRRAGSPFPLIQRLFQTIRPREIEGIAVGLGPGSYTGIRSAVAIAQGWNLSNQVPASGVSSADAIALEAIKQGLTGRIEVVIDAQRNQVYSATYELDPSVGPRTLRPLSLRDEPHGDSIVAGPEADRWSQSAIIVYPTGAAVGQLASRLEFAAPENLVPIYLRQTAFTKAPTPTRL